MRKRNIVTACSMSIVWLSLSPLAVGQGQVLYETLMHDGVERNYILYVPLTYSAGEATPLVLNLHGRGGNADQQMTTSAMNAVAEEEGFLVAYPNSVDDSWVLDTDGDVHFIDELLGTLGSQYTVDASRVYSTGFSAGGILSYVLAVTRPDTFAAIAPVAGFRRIDSEQDGSGLIPSWAPRVPPRPFPLMHVHGAADLTVPYDGGPGFFPGPPFPSLEETLDEWLACNGCDATPSLSELPDIMPDDESTVSVLSYGNCGTYLSADGDYDNDGDVDGNDFLGWQAEFGSGNGSASAAVPEPASWLLLLTGMAATVFPRRRRVVRMFRTLPVGTCPATVNFLACWTSPVDSSHPVVVCRSTLSQEKTR